MDNREKNDRCEEGGRVEDDRSDGMQFSSKDEGVKVLQISFIMFTILFGVAPREKAMKTGLRNCMKKKKI